MKQYIIKYSSALLIALALLSCTKNEKVVEKEKEGETVRFSFTLAQPESKADAKGVNGSGKGWETEIISAGFNSGSAFDTKAVVGGVDDSKVMNIWALQFDGVSNDATLVMSTYARSEKSEGLDLTDVQFYLSSGESQTVYFVTNTFNADLFSSATVGTYTIADFKAAQSTAVTASSDAIWNKYGVLPMGGVFVGDLTTGLPGTSAIIPLYRLAARISFNYSVSLADYTEYEIESITLKNIPSTFSYISKPENTSVNVPGDVYSQVSDASSLSGTAVFYMPENIEGIVSTNTTTIQKDGITGDNNKPYASYIEVCVLVNGENYCYKRITYKVYLGADAIKSYNVNSNKDYSVNTAITGVNASDTRISIVQTNIPYVITKGESNCYVIKNGDSKFTAIPVSRVNTYSPGTIGDEDEWVAEILWQTKADQTTGQVIQLSATSGATSMTGTGANERILVKGLVDEGNAVVAIYKLTNGVRGDILWTWHIWVTAVADGINAGTLGMAYETSNVFVMDRALGASSATASDGQKTYGFHYQWGRKDPFPMAKTSESTCTTAVTCYQSDISKTYTFNNSVISSTNGNVAYTVKHPTTYIYNSTTPKDWMNTQDDNLWGSTKTIYDPCPEGWRVPDNGTWSAFATSPPFVWTDSPAGRTYTYNSYTAWYPASGIRFSKTAAIQNVGTIGYSWSSSIVTGDQTEYKVYYLRFYNSDSEITPSYNSNRANGLPIRCARMYSVGTNGNEDILIDGNGNWN